MFLEHQKKPVGAESEVPPRDADRLDGAAIEADLR